MFSLSRFVSGLSSAPSALTPQSDGREWCKNEIDSSETNRNTLDRLFISSAWFKATNSVSMRVRSSVLSFLITQRVLLDIRNNYNIHYIEAVYWRIDCLPSNECRIYIIVHKRTFVHNPLFNVILYLLILKEIDISAVIMSYDIWLLKYIHSKPSSYTSCSGRIDKGRAAVFWPIHICHLTYLWYVSSYDQR